MNEMKTERTQLRRFNALDFENMRVLESDADIVKYTPYEIPQTPEQTQTRLNGLIEKENTYAPFGMWAAESKDTKDFIGWFMLLPKPTGLELGFMIVKPLWGKGFTTEIAHALIAFAFNQPTVTELKATTNLENAPSIRILNKLGFKLEKSAEFHFFSLKK